VPRRPKLRTLRQELARLHPELEDPDAEIAAGHVLVNGVPRTKPETRVAPGTSVVVRRPKPLRGLEKLRAALAAFTVPVAGRVALDAGASTGGFVQGLLEAGARRVYAVDAGHGQLLGSLRQDVRVVNLERTNVGELDRTRIPEPVELVTLDLGNLALATGVPQLNVIGLAPDADLVALVKPMNELGLAAPPLDDASLERARERATGGIERAGWRIVAGIRSPVRGGNGSIELFLHARRAP
jgi:23S rRNA (cytidine1920-2'-O)/16S rRNA (cytidine1409-2'-O)-methyltransferase